MDETRCLLTPYMIHRELYCLAGYPEGATRLHHSIGPDDVWMLWQVDNRYIRIGPFPPADLRLSLDEFSIKHCLPAVKRRQDEQR
jgi:hypothetical protein